MGCSCVMAFAVDYPQATASMLLWWPVGGAKYRIKAHQRFAEHLAFVQQHGLDAVVALRRQGRQDVRRGPARRAVGVGDQGRSRLRRGVCQAEHRRLQAHRRGDGAHLFDRDTAPGAEPEDLLRLDIPALVVPGQDAAHATSAARYLEECLPRAEYWDVPVAEQTEAVAPLRIMEFLDQASAAA